MPSTTTKTRDPSDVGVLISKLRISDPQTAQAIDSLKQSVIAANNAIAAGNSSASTSAGGTIIVDKTLTSATTNITSPVTTITAGLIFILYIRQDSTGGRQITWDATFRNPPSGLGTVRSTFSTIVFTSQLDPTSNNVMWYLMTYPVSNQS